MLQVNDTLITIGSSNYLKGNFEIAAINIERNNSTMAGIH